MLKSRLEINYIINSSVSAKSSHISECISELIYLCVHKQQLLVVPCEAEKIVGCIMLITII